MLAVDGLRLTRYFPIFEEDSGVNEVFWLDLWILILNLFTVPKPTSWAPRTQMNFQKSCRTQVWEHKALRHAEAADLLSCLFYIGIKSSAQDLLCYLF